MQSNEKTEKDDTSSRISTTTTNSAIAPPGKSHTNLIAKFRQRSRERESHCACRECLQDHQRTYTHHYCSSAQSSTNQPLHIPPPCQSSPAPPPMTSPQRRRHIFGPKILDIQRNFPHPIRRNTILSFNFHSFLLHDKDTPVHRLRPGTSGPQKPRIFLVFILTLFTFCAATIQ